MATANPLKISAPVHPKTAIAAESRSSASNKNKAGYMPDFRGRVAQQMKWQKTIGNSSKMASAAHLETLIANRPLQHVPVRPGFSNPNAPVQRYTVGSKKEKVSNTPQLLLTDDNHLFASPAKFLEANGIEGEVAFVPGTEIEVANKKLSEVIPQVKKGTSLDETISAYDQERDAERIRKDTAERVTPDVKEIFNQLFSPLEDTWYDNEDEPEKLEELFGTRDFKEFRKSKIKEAKELFAVAESSFDLGKEASYIKLMTYLKSQEDYGKRALLPSDCRALAFHISGFDAGTESQREEIDRPEAGAVYEYLAQDANMKKAEWPFHYATVIMTDGDDHVTLENAAAKASDGFSKLDYDQSWYFEMYGTDEGQTFADKYAKDMGDK